MKRSFQILVVLIIALIIPKNVLANPATQRCEPTAAIIFGGNAVYESSPNEIVRHTWQFENNSHCDWPRGVQLVFVSGNRFSGPQAYDLDQLAPGQTASVVADLQAPSNVGEYLGEWQLRVKEQALTEKLPISFAVGALQIALPAEDPIREGSDLAGIPPRDEPKGPLLPTEPLFVAHEPYVELVSTAVEVLPGEIASVDIACEEGYVVGGTWHQNTFAWEDNLEDAPRIYESRGIGNAWRFGFRNPSEDVYGYFWVQALCLRNVQGSTFNVIAPIHLSAGEVAEGNAICPAGTEIVGGGFDIYAHNGIELRTSDSDPAINGWKLKVYNTTAFSTSALVSATCFIGEDATASRVTSGWKNVDAGENGGESAICPEDTVTTNGGFGVTGFIYYYSKPYFTAIGSGLIWNVRVWNPYPVNHNVYASATCLSFP